jgi:hypothetical protein
VTGCFADLPRPAPLRQISTSQLNDKIYFAGGRYLSPNNAELSNLVEVLDTQTNEWSRFNLSVPRASISTAVVGPYILFISGQTFRGDAQVIDIWNTATQTLKTIVPPNMLNIAISVTVVGRSVFINNPFRGFYSLDVDTLDWTNYNTTDVSRITSNDTHLFAYMNEPANTIYMLDVNTTTWYDLLSIPTSATRFFYSNNMLFAISARLLYTIQTDTLLQRIYAYPTVETAIAAVTVDGHNVFIANQGLMTIHNPVQQTTIQYDFDGVPVAGSVVMHDRRLYIPANGQQQGGVKVFDLRTVFQPAPNLPRFFPPAVFERGVMFWADTGRPQIYTYNVETAEYTQHDNPAFNYSLSDRRFIYGNKMVLRSRITGVTSVSVPHLYIYDFDDHRFDVVDTPEGFLFGLATVMGDTLVINGQSFDLWLFNISSYTFTKRSWFNQLSYITSTRDLLVAIVIQQTHLIDLTTMESFMIDLNINSNALLTFDTIFVAVTNDPDEPMLIVYDVEKRESQQTPSSLISTRLLPQAQIVNGRYALFVGPKLDGTGLRVEMYDTLAQQWIKFDLPSSGPNDAISSFTVSGNQLFFAFRVFIDVYDMTTNTLSVFPFQFANIHRLTTVGSKLIVQNSGLRGSNMEVSLFIFELSTRRYFSVSFYGISVQSFFATWKNNIYYLFREMMTMELPAIMEAFDNEELFIGKSTNFTVNAAGTGLRYIWNHNREALNEETATLQLNNVTTNLAGTYKVTVTDTCNRPMEHAATLTVYNVPYFDVKLQDSIALCDEEAALSIQATGEQISYHWSINGANQADEVTSTLTLTKEQLPCNSQNLVCVTASNPSGGNTTCARVRLAKLDSLVSGPAPVNQKSRWFAEDIVDLQVDILDDDCTQHWWLRDGVWLESFTSSSSQRSVKLSASKERSQFVVKVQCGNNNITSLPFSFGEISSIPVYGLVLMIISIVIAVVLFVGIVFGLRKRLVQSQSKEVELTTLLSKAKTESLKKDRTPILNATVWEWTPTDDFIYQSSSDLPVGVSTSDLKFSEKGAPLEVDMYYNRVIKFDNKSKSSSKKGLKEKLIHGTTIDIYAPKSPKYQIVVEPASFVIDSNDAVEVTVSLKMQMTAKCNITLVLVLEQHKIYSAIEFKVTSNLSTWIDLEEIQMTGEFLGGGG